MDEMSYVCTYLCKNVYGCIVLLSRFERLILISTFIIIIFITIITLYNY